MSTYGQMITEIAAALGNRETLADKVSISRALNYGTIVTALSQNLPELQKNATINFEAGKSQALLSIEDLLYVIAIYSSMSHRRVFIVSPNRWNLIFPKRIGEDIYVSRWGNFLRAKNINPAGDSLIIDYLAFPQMFRVGMENQQFPYNKIEGLTISTALEYMWAFLEETEAHAGWSKVKESIKNAIPPIVDMGVIERAVG